MSVLGIPLLSLTDTPYANGPVQVVYEFARLRSFDDQRWFLGALTVVVLAVLVFSWTMIRRDTIDQRRVIRYLLLAFRTGTIALLVLFFLQPRRRAVRRSVRTSQVLVLVDVSQSMGLADRVRRSTARTGPRPSNRLAGVVTGLARGPMLADLRRVHDVQIYGFDREAKRVGLLPKAGSIDEDANRRVAAARPGPGQPVAGAGTWQTALRPQGSETRLGDALRTLIHDQRTAPVAGVIAITDGQQNAGVDPDVAIRLARTADIPIFTVGIGSDRTPVNVRVSDVVAPAKAYGGDTFTLTGYLQARGLAGRTVTVELLTRQAGNRQGAEVVQDTARVILGGDREVVPATFRLAAKTPGRQTYRFRVKPPPEDSNVQDNQQAITVEIVDRASRVLLLAGAATREYRFVRNLLWRDKDVTTDVLLQTSPPGIAQDANHILDHLPDSKETLYAYDALIAFDPDWTRLDARQLALLDSWVADQAAGLILVAGPIHTAQSLGAPEQTAIRNLYPVVFRRQLALIADSSFGAESPLPIRFTREGAAARFLWLGETATQSAAAWSAFPGLFGCYPTRRAKPGATVYAHLIDPDLGPDGKGPILFAEQFYGSGRVFYLGTGQMWRLRGLDAAYFDKFYTKLLRHVAQGRLLRGSTRGLLLVERDRCVLGETIPIRAQLTDDRHEPLKVPQVTAQVTCPDGATESVPLQADPARPGMFSGQVTVMREGTHRIDLPVPGAAGQQLTRTIQVRIPDQEREHPQRNDALLSQIAVRTGGHYYVGLDAAQGLGAVPALAPRLRDRTEVTLLVGAPDRQFEKRLMYWLSLGICGLLFLEWTTRRLCRLA